MKISIEKMKQDFPFLKTGVAYLDNASTSQKPQQVIDATSAYYAEYSANVHRGIYTMSEQATTAYEDTRESVRAFINAARTEEIIFTSGTTAGINMLAQMLGNTYAPGDEIILSPLEHHANLVPWQMIAKEKDLTLKFFTLSENQTIDPQELDVLITKKTRLVTVSHISNASGYVMPIAEITKKAHERGVLVAVDGAQSVPHIPVDVQNLDIDFLTFSGHKMCGPTGVGVLWGRFDLLDRLEPSLFGGSMIETVNLTTSTWAPLPLRLEPGTPNIAGVVGLGVAIDYLQGLGMETIEKKITELYTYLWDQIHALSGVTTYGPPAQEMCHGILSFTVDGIHAHDVASILDQEGVACRAGHHCAQPLMDLWCVPATIRASLSFYNTKEDIDRLIAGIKKAKQLLG